MRPLSKVTFVVDQFVRVPSIEQQLVDRFLIGYNRGPGFYSPGCEVQLLAKSSDSALLKLRTQEHGLKVLENMNQATTGAECVVVAGGASTLEQVVKELPSGARCFVYGVLAPEMAKAEELVALAEQRGVTLKAGQASGSAFALPELEPTRGKVRKALVVGHGEFPAAELEALMGLWGLEGISKPWTGKPTVQAWTGGEVWKAAYSQEWKELFAAAISRSNTIQGDPEKDGRTQDVAGLRLVEKLAAKPRGWLVEANGVQTALFILNGVLEDINVALEISGGKTLSTQLYRPPPPQQDHYSKLSAQIEDFFRKDSVKTDPEPLVHQAAVMEAILRLRNE